MFLPVSLALVTPPIADAQYFSERFETRSISVTEGGNRSMSEGSSTSCTARFTIPLAVTKRTKDTPFEVSVGGWTINGTLGADPQFRPGASTVTMLDDEELGNSIWRRNSQLKFTFGPKSVTVTLEGCPSGSTSIVAESFQGMSLAKQVGFIKVRVAFGTQSAMVTIPIQASHIETYSVQSNVVQRLSVIEVKTKGEPQPK